MPKSVPRTYSAYSSDAMTLLSLHIRTARLERKISTQELAERAGISRSMLQRIEKADMKCEIGAVFEVATLVGVPLFDADNESLSKHIRQTRDKLALLPKKARKPTKNVDDDF